MKRVRVGIYQSRLKGYIPESIIKLAKKSKINFFVLPEYFFSRFDVKKISENSQFYEYFLKYIKKISKKLKDIIIIGTLIKKENSNFYNTGFAMINGEEIAYHKKINLFGREIGDITPGDLIEVFEYNKIRFAILICADVLHDKNFEFLKENKPDIIFIPTFSPYKKETINEKIKRDKNIFLKRAEETNSFIVKVCGVNTKGLPYPIQGRSLICNKESIIYRVPFYLENSELFKVFSLKLIK
ncbi:MAG TPA: carbon-nitrogen hydrolase family protein [Spirochaetota bacterium]|nr:carbon-nitrogen hydrolase family protein [Spirochaetota bacterium]HOM37769.1 carbon-nitrogen hydrolase family protein [Spirochaetota bacterium]HPQ49354.1 carbon-nitrogen hydrolase family protein [Spirochaetota bacterium]